MARRKNLNHTGLYGIYTSNARGEWILVAAIADKRDTLLTAMSYRNDYFKVQIRYPWGEVILHDQEGEELA